jgi:hypothetical protein
VPAKARPRAPHGLQVIVSPEGVMSDRRNFLRGLATLPLIGGSVAILGKPTAAAVTVTPDLL